MIFTLTDKNKEASENYKELWSEIGTIRGIEPIKYEKDFIKIKFESDDDLPLGKIPNIPVCMIIVKSVFQENNKYYPQGFCMNVFMSMNVKMKMILMLFIEVLRDFDCLIHQLCKV